MSRKLVCLIAVVFAVVVPGHQAQGWKSIPGVVNQATDSLGNLFFLERGTIYRVPFEFGALAWHQKSVFVATPRARRVKIYNDDLYLELKGTQKPEIQLGDSFGSYTVALGVREETTIVKFGLNKPCNECWPLRAACTPNPRTNPVPSGCMDSYTWLEWTPTCVDGGKSAICSEIFFRLIPCPGGCAGGVCK